MTEGMCGPGPRSSLHSQHQPPWLVATSYPCPGSTLVTTCMLGTSLLANAGDQAVEVQSRCWQLGKLPPLWSVAQVEMTGLMLQAQVALAE